MISSSVSTENLRPDHLAMLTEGSGLSLDVIGKRGYRTCSGYSEIKSLGITLRRDTDTHGLLIPLYTTEGKPGQSYIAKEDRSVPLTIYRPDKPEIDHKGRPRKYLFPGGQHMRLDCHPHAYPMLADPTIPVWITEGQKKGDNLVSHGLCALALLGVWNWRGSNGDGGTMALPDWHYVALNDREVRIVFDSDCADNPGVRDALRELTRFLTARGAVVHIAYLPSANGAKVGVDDYMVADHTVDDLERLLEAPRRATRPVSTIANLKRNDKGEPRPVLSNILEILTQDARWHGVFGYDEFAQVETLTRCPPYLPEPDTWVKRPLKDCDDAETSNWLQHEYDLCAATSLVAEAIPTATLIRTCFLAQRVTGA